ncbi:hypothetical protein NX059_002264 [Plenodomus lindquistii]|nr:hypothetical protein NX059_002264 [Plenodomus lindquistii]
MTQPLRESDILFPHQANTPSLSNTLSTLRRSTLSLHNRLTSIVSDSLFVTSVASAYDLPLVANERCGSWYIPPSQKAGSVYFKSTDGHMGQWKFSLRRLNLQLLNVVAERGGAVVVDSTRRGKSMPDALSKTVPVWCAVVNRAVFGETGEEGRLYVPPSVVGEGERVQMEERIGGFVKQFLDICKPHLPTLRAKLTKPLRPIWITQASSVPSSPPLFPDFHPVVLCTASRRVQGAEISENGYIQGAADDHEAWAHGITPQLFWRHKDLLMSTSEDEAPSVIEKLITDEDSGIATATLISPTRNLYISSSENVDLSGFDVVIACTLTPLPISSSKEQSGAKHHLHLKCQTGKLGSRDLRTQLPQIRGFLASLPIISTNKILVCCPTGKDLSVGTALAILCLASDEKGHMNGNLRTDGITKDFIKQRLSWITTSNPSLNPSRATLQSVNAVLFDTHTPTTPLPRDKTNTPATSASLYKIAVRTSTPLPSETPPPPHPSKQQNDNNSSPAPLPPLPPLIFNALHTPAPKPWLFSRTLSSALPTHPSGRVTGTATFTPCAPVNGTPTLLYAEEGEFVLDNGMKFGVRRRYVYLLKDSNTDVDTDGDGDGNGNGENDTLREKEGYIAVHFFDDEKMGKADIGDGVGGKGEGVGGLFVEMGGLSEDDGGMWRAENKERHLCVEDLYAASWRFGRGMVGVGMRGGEGGEKEDVWWEVRYDVKGPKKDYTSRTRYTLS